MCNRAGGGLRPPHPPGQGHRRRLRQQVHHQEQGRVDPRDRLSHAVRRVLRRRRRRVLRHPRLPRRPGQRRGGRGRRQADGRAEEPAEDAHRQDPQVGRQDRRLRQPDHQELLLLQRERARDGVGRRPADPEEDGGGVRGLLGAVQVRGGLRGPGERRPERLALQPGLRHDQVDGHQLERHPVTQVGSVKGVVQLFIMAPWSHNEILNCMYEV